MKLYEYKKLDYGFVVLCFEHQTKLAANTIKSIHRNYPGSPVICIIDSSANADDLKELKEICPTHKGNQTFSSLINLGMKKAATEWNFIVVAGTWVRSKLDIRFSRFVENEKDVLFPIADRKTNFVDATINGLFLNKNTYNLVGDMPNNNSLETCKLTWAMDALKLGCTFKAIQGVKIC